MDECFDSRKLCIDGNKTPNPYSRSYRKQNVKRLKTRKELRMKQFELKFWTYVPFDLEPTLLVKRVEAYVTVRVTPTVWPKEGCPNGFMFNYKNGYHMFVDHFQVVNEKSTPDWEDYFEVNLEGADHLVIRPIPDYQIYMNFPDLVLDVPD